jgi:hypothetical protein
MRIRVEIDLVVDVIVNTLVCRHAHELAAVIRTIVEGGLNAVAHNGQPANQLNVIPRVALRLRWIGWIAVPTTTATATLGRCGLATRLRHWGGLVLPRVLAPTLIALGPEEVALCPGT